MLNLPPLVLFLASPQHQNPSLTSYGAAIMWQNQPAAMCFANAVDRAVAFVLPRVGYSTRELYTHCFHVEHVGVQPSLEPHFLCAKNRVRGAPPPLDVSWPTPFDTRDPRHLRQPANRQPDEFFTYWHQRVFEKAVLFVVP